MNQLLKRISAAIVALGLVFGLTACGPQKIEMKKITAVIDVRTPAEYVEAHLKDAVNIDVQAGDFESIIMSLDANRSYVVYCKSGNRAGIAKDKMVALGFVDVVNAGSMQEAAKATGLPIVKFAG